MRLPRLPRLRGDGVEPEPSATQSTAAASVPVPSFGWERFADGRPRRLKRGKHFAGEPKFLQREARRAAAEMGKVAIVSRDQQGKWGYVWIQFLDAEVKEDEPCPVCGSLELLKLNNEVMRCPSCGSALAFVPHPLEMPAGLDPEGPPIPPRRDASELAEIVSTRVLRPDGSDAERPSTDEDLMFEITVRSNRPGLRLRAAIAAHVEEQRIFVSRSPDWVELPRPALYRARAHIPSRLLTDHRYRVKVSVAVDDGTGGDLVWLHRRTGATIAPREETGEGPDEGLFRPALAWTAEALDAEDADTDLVFPDGSART